MIHSWQEGLEGELESFTVEFRLTMPFSAATRFFFLAAHFDLIYLTLSSHQIRTLFHGYIYIELMVVIRAEYSVYQRHLSSVSFVFFSLKSALWDVIDWKSSLDYIMTWRLFGAKPLCKPMMTRFTDAHMRH